ncbi:MAG: hypothetical protein ACYDCK_09220 [Thermoplasmatota archaeon]
MENPRRLAGLSIALAVLAVAAAIGLGISLRLVDPLSSPSLPAEDPYTHMAYVREDLRDGTLDPLVPGGTAYPPGLHAFIAAAWVFTGLDLYAIMRFGPVVFGAISILGVALLLGRGEGRVAAAVGALALALAPEAIFRTTMMAPTALDLAYLPFFMLALLELVRGRLAWAAVLTPFALFIVLAHPWLFALLGAAGGVFLALAMLLPWSASRAPRFSSTGVALALLIVSAGLAGSVASCWTGCGGADFGDALSLGHVASLGLIAYGIAGLGALLGVLLLLPFRPFLAVRKLLVPRRVPRVQRVIASVLLAVALVLVTLPAVKHGMPKFVDLHFMLGYPLLALAALAFVALPFVASPTALFGAALAIVTYPFVIYNPLASDFWPSRTAVYFGLAAVVLAGVAARALLAAVAWLAPRAKRLAARTFRSPVKSARAPGRVALVLPALVVGVLLAGAVYAETPAPYPTWYRLYGGCEFSALQDVAALAAASPHTVVVTGSWEAKVVLAALAPDASRIWYVGGFFSSETTRAKLSTSLLDQGHSIIAVIEPHFASETPADLRFLSSPPWQPVSASCASSLHPADVLVYEEAASPT